MNTGGRASPTDFATAVALALFMPLADPSRPSFRQNLARPDSHVALCFTRPVGEISLTSSATAVVAVLVVPFALDQASPEDTAGSDSVVTLCLGIPGDREEPATLADTASTGVVEALCFLIPVGASPADFAFAAAATGVSLSPSR